MTPQTLRIFTDLGDAAVILPLFVLLVVGLVWLESWRAAWYLARAAVACLAVMAALKLLFISCGPGWGLDVVSPSGHASLGLLFYGSLALILARHWPALRWLLYAAAVALAAPIATSRVILHHHTPREVVIGVVVAAVCLYAFARPYLRLSYTAHPWRVAACLAACAVVLGVCYGRLMPAERMLRNYAVVLPFCKR